eukprot:COSAG02_NODE_3587_length_6520_cov_6.037060_2_plen_51_part_00
MCRIRGEDKYFVVILDLSLNYVLLLLRTSYDSIDTRIWDYFLPTSIPLLE